MKASSMFPAYLWLALYLILSTVIGNLAATDQQVYYIGALPQLLLAVSCLVYLVKTKLHRAIHLVGIPTESAAKMLYYLPLFFVTSLSLFYGLRTDLNWLDYLALLAMYTGVGFMEEVIFRGVMFTALSTHWNRWFVIFFISFTFAVGHIVSMVAMNMSGWETTLQIINAFVVGFLFMLVMVASKNLRVCIVAHILYNFFANISLVSTTQVTVIVVTVVITLAYSTYLWKNSTEIHEYLNQTPSISV